MKDSVTRVRYVNDGYSEYNGDIFRYVCTWDTKPLANLLNPFVDKVVATDLGGAEFYSNGTSYVAVGNTTAISTWANKPTIETLEPYIDRVMITDVGMGGSEWYSDGTRYRAVGGQVVLKNDATGSTSTTATTETKMASFAIPAGLLQAGDLIKVEWKLQKTAAEAIAVNQFAQIHNTDSFQAPPASLQAASLASGGFASYEFTEWKVVDSTHIKTLSPFTGTGYATGGGSNYPDRVVSDLSVNAITIGIYAKYASTPSTSNVICENLTATLKTCG